MASAYGNVVQRWQSYIEASITSQTDTTATITLNVYFHSIGYGYKVRANADGTINGVKSAVANFSATSGTGQTVNQLAVTHTVTVSKGSSAQNISVSGRVQLTGGFHNGTSTAYATVSVPARTYYKPHPPKSFAAKRTSDTQMDLTWQGDYTGMDGGYPWSGVYVDRRVDDGSWVNIANLSWDAINYSDRTTSANHKYEYRVCSYGPGGTSDHATASALYTTPAAPDSVTMTKTSGTSVRVDVDGSNAPYATSWDVQKSLNGGEWKDVGNYTTFPQTIDVGGGTAKLRARSKRDSLLSGWTESGTITTIVAPNAPTITAKPASVIAVGSSAVISWTPNHPDGSAQTQAQVEYQIGSAAAQTATVQGSVTTYRLPSSATASAGTVKVRVRTHGIDPDWGAWTSYYSFAVAVPPEAHFTTPGIDGAKIGDLPLTVEWEVTDSTGVAAQTIQLLDDSGNVLHTANPATGSREYELGAGTYQLSNATSYRLRLTVRGGSSLTVTTERTFAMSFAEPSRPTASVALDESKMAQTVTVQAGPTTSDEADVLQVEATPGTLVPGFTVFGNTRQNLWVNPRGTQNGVTCTPNADGSITVSGTATAGAFIVVQSYALRPGTQYTLSVDKSTNARGFYVDVVNADNQTIQVVYVGGSQGMLISETFTLKSNAVRVRFGFGVDPGTTASGTYRVMLNEGSEPQPWCPPGLNGVDELGIVTAGKNLAKMESVSYSGVDATVNEDGSVTINGTATGVSWLSLKRGIKLPKGEDVTLSIDRSLSGTGVAQVYLAQYYVGEGVHDDVITLRTGTSGTYTVPDDSRGRTYLIGMGVNSGATVVNQTFRVQLELGPTATDYEQPQVTTTPIDLDGHTLNSLPDGTRDELRIDGTGAVTLVQMVGVATAPTAASGLTWDSIVSRGRFTLPATSRNKGTWYQSKELLCDKLPPATSVNDVSHAVTVNDGGFAKNPAITSTATAATVAGGATYLYPLAAPQEVDLPGIAMPAFPAAETQVFCASNVPCEVRVDYPDTESLSVTRVLADGSRWLVADGLTSGQQAIDPLPPLNTDYAYEVTASTGAGAIVSASFAQRIDSRGRMALNFGAAASVAHVMGANAKVSYDESADGELYHFADGGESGGLPQFYGTGDIDASGSVSFELMDRSERDRFKRSARRYAVGWFRDAMGGRIRARMGYSESVSAGGIAVWEESVDMDEVIFEEAW